MKVRAKSELVCGATMVFCYEDNSVFWQTVQERCERGFLCRAIDVIDWIP
jgi:hypothetical protein